MYRPKVLWSHIDSGENAAIEELTTLSDRSAAIVGSTLVESRLKKLLEKNLSDLCIKKDRFLREEMFRNSGPLGAFSTRLNLGYMLGLYEEDSWRDLDAIRSVRNDFAHLTSVNSFNDDSVRDRCKKLRVCDKNFSAAQDDEWIVGARNGVKSGIHLRVTDIKRKLTIPRERYTLCVMYYSKLFHLLCDVPADRQSKPIYWHV